MIKLNNEVSQKAWDDYKGFLEGISGEIDPKILARYEMVFKYGFSYGASSKSEPKPMKVFKMPVEVVEDITPKFIKNRKRTDAEIESDARLVSSIMQRRGIPMRLQEITEAVNAAGGQWYEKSASGHMSRVMEQYPTIKKVGYGLYEYQG